MYPVSTSIHFFIDPAYGMTLAEQVTIVAQCGFSYLDFNFCDWHGRVDSPFCGDGWEAWIDSAGEAAAKEGAVFNQAHAPCHDGIRYPGLDAGGMQKLMERAVLSCARLGIPQMVYHPVQTGDPRWKEINYELFAPVMEISARCGVGMAFENISRIRQATEDLIEFTDGWHDPLAGICWDAGHGFFTEGNASAETDPYVHLMKIGKRLRATHIHDNLGYSDDHLPPFEGILPWERMMRGLHDIGYAHSFTFEAHHAVKRLPPSCLDLAQEKLRYLAKLGKRMVAWTPEQGFGTE